LSEPPRVVLMDTEDLRAFEGDTRNQVPGFQVAWKTDSWLQKAIGLLLRAFNPSYLTNFITTFYPKVYFPSKLDYERSPSSSFIVLAHERVHLLDTQASPVWFRVSYLLPQLFFIPFVVAGIVTAFFSWWAACILFFVGLLCLGPWPSPWRTHWEKRGYAMTLAVSYWATGSLPVGLGKSVTSHFTGWDYYRMSWSDRDMQLWLMETAQSVRDGTLVKDHVYADVLAFMRRRGLVKI